MAHDSILLDKALHFAARIIRLNNYLTKSKHEIIISKQIVRSGTSIGANANEAIYGSSKADFINKLQIALKECAETEYWLRLLILSEYSTKTAPEKFRQILGITGNKQHFFAQRPDRTLREGAGTPAGVPAAHKKPQKMTFFRGFFIYSTSLSR